MRKPDERMISNIGTFDKGCENHRLVIITGRVPNESEFRILEFATMETITRYLNFELY